MGTGKRGLIATAVAVVCAVTVLAAPGTAFASPSPTPVPSAGPTLAPGKDLEAVRKKLDELYRAAARATDEYNAAEEKADKQSAEIAELAKKIVKGRQKLEKLKDRAGASAAAQYRGGGLPPEAHLMLSDDPQEFLDGAGRVRQGQHATKGLIGELTRTQEDLKQYAQDASAQWKKLEAGRKAKAAAQKKIEKQIAQAEKLESELQKEEQERLAELEKEAAHKAQTAWLDSGILDEISTKASEQGKKAVAYATAQIGKPYQWGAEGPKTYDCSGLTSQAWISAGQGIPRTSQEQWKRLRHIDIQDMRPGDLIIYFGDASHVAMYVGDGAIVHAPRPGRTVTLAGAGTMPILGVVRPDADAGTD
ncbi:C40 family peptidase [Streptomyces caelestis]|jgi:cell wall-associated NlpC family hydrolase/low affinity Fe/Cu permease|uniref:Cell wall-associated NlpC family hydrolase/low affinity Fe/Cu permease n=1 Tax=Streptomyces caelestis TaxID=36816 RepID=A0A7W9H4V8_9ACTN|nr:C40 family peptidase [Streptomyces caelestis]MBB5795737.1 cell wall-associated NlpC family hydrolase/low affinity Fe/Cu permease [Streptomyces caelestis]GGW77015.1 glycoside hydrolase [Streptomyces caelestis]